MPRRQMCTNDLGQTCSATVLPPILYYVSVLFVPSGGHCIKGMDEDVWFNAGKLTSGAFEQALAEL